MLCYQALANDLTISSAVNTVYEPLVTDAFLEHVTPNVAYDRTKNWNRQMDLKSKRPDIFTSHNYN